MRRWIFSGILFLLFTAAGLAQSTTTNLGIAKPQSGQAQPNVTIATGFDSFDAAVAGRLYKTGITGGTTTLTASEARNAILEFVGPLASSSTIIVPTSNKLMLVYNGTTGAFTLTVKTASGTGIAVTQGSRVWLYCDGTNVVETSISSGGANNALSNLSTTTINTALIPQTGKDLGATTTPWKDLYLYGSGTFGSHSWKFTGTPTANRTITIPDGTFTIAGIALAQTLDNKTLSNTTAFSGFYDVTRITAPSNPSAGSLRLFAETVSGKLACLDSSGADCMPSGGGGGATTTLNNLGSVSINAALGFQTTLSVGSTTTPPQYLYLYGAGTFGSHSIRLGGTPTGHRQVVFPDANTNLLGDATAQTVSTKTIDNTNTFSGYSDRTRIAAPSNPSAGSLRLYADNGTGKLACLDSSGADCMPAGSGSGTVNTGAQYKIAHYPSAGTTVDDLSNWTTDAQGAFTLAPTAASSGNPAAFTVTIPANTAVTAGADNTVINFNMSATQQHATGAVTINRSMLVQAPTLSAAGSSTITDAITFDLNTPTAGSNVTITRATGLRITGTNNGDHLAWFNHKVSSTGDVLALGLSNTKVVRFISNNGTINNVMAANGALASNATDGFTWLGEYSGTGAPTGVPTSYTGAEAIVLQRDNVNAVYDLWAYSNSAWRSIGGQFKRYDTGSGNGAQTVDFNSSSAANVTRVFTASGGNATLTFSNPPPAGSLVTVVIVQDGTGSRTITWPGSVVWVAGAAPTLTTTASKRDAFVFMWNGSNYYELSRALNL